MKWEEALKALIVKVLVCGECVRTGVEPDRIYKASDSSFGEDMIRQHLLKDHGIEVGRAR
jgi:hypothetical protein